jgi:DNA-directed RNA polymerase subunit RPC12/RpoP
MAELHLYKCKKCGWEVEAPSEGADMLMFSIMACYVCRDCQHVFKKYYALGTVFNGKVSCPHCGCEVYILESILLDML